VDIQVIHNGVDRRSLESGELRLNRPARIFFAGRFVAQKNPLQIIETLNTVKDLEWDCVLVGDGPLREKMTRQIRAAGLENRIHLPGWIAPEEVIQLMCKSDILFMPSLSEGLSVVGVQSLAMGLAIVASLSGGFMDLVEDGANGYLIDLNQPEDYGRVLRDLLSNPDKLLYARRASYHKAEDFDLQAIVRAYEDLFIGVNRGRG
jgi:glycosyltransferase involved in cell wall biosynthesis